MGGQAAGTGGAGGTASGSTTGSTTSSTTGTGGAPGACLTNTDCKNFPVQICHVATCQAGSCVAIAMASVTDQKPDAVGDCKKYFCDGSGNIAPVEDKTDPPLDWHGCAIENCGGVIQPMTCTLPMGGTGFCETAAGGARCSECSDTALCVSGEKCAEGICRPSTCNDQIQEPDLGETGVDCGGPCLPCQAGGTCKADSDCITRNCVNTKCVQAACGDGKADGLESDVDCGSQCPVKCAANHKCRSDADCMTNKCYDGTCRAPTCYDNLENQGEAGVDCGGPCPYLCP